MSTLATASIRLIGVLLVIGSIFEVAIVTSRAHNHHELASIQLSALLMLLCGIGFLLPHALANLVSSLSLVSAGVWLLCSDSFRSQNWWIYLFFLIPLLLTLYRLRETNGLRTRGLQDAN